MSKLKFFVAAIALCLTANAIAETSQEQVNKKNVLGFYELALNQKLGQAAADKYVGSHYVQHNPGAPDGPQGFVKFIDFLRAKYPQSHSEIKQAFADGNYVILHVHAVREPDTRGDAIVDIFRLDDQGKIVEHWDVVQPIPDQAVNNNGMF
jgi:predicted SnoaL-like aldol condensation-catalyzing enzyme